MHSGAGSTALAPAHRAASVAFRSSSSRFRHASAPELVGAFSGILQFATMMHVTKRVRPQIFSRGGSSVMYGIAAR